MSDLLNRFYQEFDLVRHEDNVSETDYRTPFQVDRDRILYTQAFRKLQAKTQVFQTGAYDFYRTRLTHSLEVAQIGRSLTHYLRKHSEVLAPDFYPDPDLVEAVSLTHDIGHPPFGHAGERVLNELMHPYGGFEGNAQSLRLVSDLIFESSRRFRGSNPTRAFLDGILKYKSTWSEAYSQKNTPPKNHFIYDDQLPLRTFAHGGEYTNPAVFTKSLECQIMDWADDTAYSLNDLSDGLRSGLLAPDKVQRWLEAHEEWQQIDPEIRQRFESGFQKRSLESFCGTSIGRFIRAVELVPTSHPLSQHSHRYAWDLRIDPAIKQECKLYKSLAFELIFQSEPLQQMEAKASRMLREMFALLMDNYLTAGTSRTPLHLIPALWEQQLVGQDEITTARWITDYLASLTDGQALRFYRRIFSPEADNLLDLLA